MSEKPQIELQDIAKESEPKSEGLEVTKGPELDQVVDNANAIHEAMQQDKNITLGQMQDFEKSLEVLRYDFYGEQLTIAEIRQIPDLQNNLKIWREIEERKYDNYKKITYLPPKIALLLGESKVGEADEDGFLYILELDKLRSISDEAAKQISLSGLQGELCLNGLESVNDTVSHYLSSWGDEESSLILNGITILSDKATYNFSQFQGDLSLSNLESVSEKGIEYLCQNDIHAPKIKNRLNAFRRKSNK